MTRDECVSMIQEQLGFRTNLATNIVSYMKLAQITLEQGPTLPWFLISEQNYITTVANEQRLVLPTDFIREIDEARFVYIPDSAEDDTSPVDLVKDDYDDLATQYKDAMAGPPEAYALIGKYFRIFPTPDDLYTIKMIYYKKDDTLDTNIENLWLANVPKLFMGLAGKDIATPLRDTEAYKTFSSWESEGRLLLLNFTEARMHANRVYQQGGQT